jgi:hypothetical protein
MSVVAVTMTPAARRTDGGCFRNFDIRRSSRFARDGPERVRGVTARILVRPAARVVI